MKEILAWMQCQTYWIRKALHTHKKKCFHFSRAGVEVLESAIRLSLGKLFVNLLKVIKRTNTPLLIIP